MNNYLAIDIGASSGRAIVGNFDGTVNLTEISRFTIEIEEIDNKLRLNINKLVNDVTSAVKNATRNYNVTSIGIDTWAVDFVALDKEGNLVDKPMFYRDQSFIDELNRQDNLYELYSETGIQIQPFNTYFQLNILEQNYDISTIDKLLLLPDYLSYVLCGTYNLEWTNATTTQCLKAKTNELIHEKASLFPKLSEKRKLGKLKDEFKYDKDVEVISVASHDTASAHTAIPNIDENTAFLSSGTWSLLGVNVNEPITLEKAFNYNFSNEGNYNRSYRFQKNIMGLWIVTQFAKEINEKDFAKISASAYHSDCNTIIDVNNEMFFNPQSMKSAIRTYCENNELISPKTNQDFARVIYRSLAASYKKTLDEIEEITNKQVDNLIIVGGGAKANFLNEQTALLTGKQIYTYPYESSSLGNIYVQAVQNNEFDSIEDVINFSSKYLELKKLEK